MRRDGVGHYRGPRTLVIGDNQLRKCAMPITLHGGTRLISSRCWVARWRPFRLGEGAAVCRVTPGGLSLRRQHRSGTRHRAPRIQTEHPATAGATATAISMMGEAGAGGEARAGQVGEAHGIEDPRENGGNQAEDHYRYQCSAPGEILG